MTYLQSERITAWVTDLEDRCDDIATILNRLLDFTSECGFPNLSQFEKDEFSTCLDFMDSWMPGRVDTIMEIAIDGNLYDDAIYDWAQNLDTKLRSLVEEILGISPSKPSLAAASVTTASEVSSSSPPSSNA